MINGTKEMMDEMLNDEGPVALVVKENLKPVEGWDSPVFPPTFAGVTDYLIDETEGKGGVCILDTVQSQANRMEPIFRDKYSHLVPQIYVNIGDETVNVLDVGHRIADACVRFSEMAEEISLVFKEYGKGNCEPIIRLAPTSILFGVWDSRGSGIKIGRSVRSVIRAFGVERLSRAGQYFAPLRYKEVLPGFEEIMGKGKTDKNKGAKLGMVDIPHGPSGGGVIVTGGIVRKSVFHLIKIRRMGNDDTMRRYLLGLGIMSLLHPMDMDLRQGCNLIKDMETEEPLSMSLIWRDGSEKTIDISLDEVVQVAEESAQAANIPGEKSEIIVTFDKNEAKKAMKDL